MKYRNLAIAALLVAGLLGWGVVLAAAVKSWELADTPGANDMTLGTGYDDVIFANTGDIVAGTDAVSRTATQTVTNSVTLTADNTLTRTVETGIKYGFEVSYWFTTVATSGVQVDMAGGTATVSAFQGDGTIWNLSAVAAPLAQNELTALATTVGFTATGVLTKVEMEGTFTASSTGTFIPRFAQNAETGAAESVIAKVGSRMRVWRMP